MKTLPNFLVFYETLSPEKRRLIDRQTEMETHQKGKIIFEQGSFADAVYAVEKGVVEVVLHAEKGAQPRSVAYLSNGDIFGEMGVITGRPRISTIRICEDALLRKFSRDRFFKLMEVIPTFGIFLASNLAERLYLSTSNHYYMSYSVDFSGNTENFDLLIIFQTLQSSSRTGELVLTNANNDVIGSFYFINGDVQYARFLHLYGVEAIWQLFIEEKLDGSFAFQVADKPNDNFDPEQRISLRGMDLLMQAASKRDTYQILAPSSKDLTRELSRIANTFTWDDPETEKAAGIIWQHIQKRPQTLGTLWRLTNLSVSTIIDVTRRMREQSVAILSESDPTQN